MFLIPQDKTLIQSQKCQRANPQLWSECIHQLQQIHKISIKLMQKNTGFCLDKNDDEEDQFQDQNAFGGVTSVEFADLSKQSKVALGPYDDKRKHMTIWQGLNLKGKCENPSCSSSESKNCGSWVPKGYGNFELNEMRFENKCQGCGKELKPESFYTFGFTMAKLKVQGRKKTVQGYQRIKPIDLIEKEGKFIKFQDQGEITKVQWVSMKITVQKV